MSRNLQSNPSEFLSVFIKHYLIAALFSTVNEGEKATSESLDGQYQPKDFEMQTFIEMAQDCTMFIAKVIERLEADDIDRLEASQCGHDFWLTRNGHGAGFWDRTELEANDLGDRLTEIAKEFAEYNLYGDGTHVRKL